jgi:hypothetical protein
VEVGDLVREPVSSLARDGVGVSVLGTFAGDPTPGAAGRVGTSGRAAGPAFMVIGRKKRWSQVPAQGAQEYGYGQHGSDKTVWPALRAWRASSNHGGLASARAGLNAPPCRPSSSVRAHSSYLTHLRGRASRARLELVLKLSSRCTGWTVGSTSGDRRDSAVRERLRPRSAGPAPPGNPRRGRERGAPLGCATAPAYRLARWPTPAIRSFC